MAAALRASQLRPWAGKQVYGCVGAAKRRCMSDVAGLTPLTGGKGKAKELLPVLEETIRAAGPMPVSRFMTLCLAHPEQGYYMSQPALGSQGDFITSPEISQIFGECLAIWLVTQWLAQGKAANVRLIELGPGRGTLMADILRTFKALGVASRPPVNSVHLVESSERMRAQQKALLDSRGLASGVDVKWYDSLAGVEPDDEAFTMVIAHEFFDALPIHIFEHVDKGWREVLVDVADPKAIIIPNKKPEPLRLVLAPSPTPASLLYTSLSEEASKTPSPTLPRFGRLPKGSRMEISPASWEIAEQLGKAVSGARGGAGLVVDYGDAKGFGRSWRGFRKHQVVDPLSEPGRTDLTANVDFAALATSMEGVAATHGPITQSSFLHALGLQPRLEALLRAAPEGRKSIIESAAKRLVDLTAMGKEYKVMAVTPKKEGAAEECFPFVEGVE